MHNFAQLLFSHFAIFLLFISFFDIQSIFVRLFILLCISIFFLFWYTILWIDKHFKKLYTDSIKNVTTDIESVLYRKSTPVSSISEFILRSISFRVEDRDKVLQYETDISRYSL